MANSTRRDLRSHSPSGRFYSSPSSNSSFASSSSSAFTTPSSPFLHNRSSSPTRINVYRSSSSSSSSSSMSTVRFSLDSRSISPSRTISVKKRLQAPRRMCMCSPTSHPGSFRCSLHKNSNNNNNNNHNHTASYRSNGLNARRSAMTNSLVRIGTVEGGDLVKRALAALIRPSSHQQRRRTAFQPRPSRLSAMTTADEL